MSCEKANPSRDLDALPHPEIQLRKHCATNANNLCTKCLPHGNAKRRAVVDVQEMKPQFSRSIASEEDVEALPGRDDGVESRYSLLTSISQTPAVILRSYM